MDTEPPMAQAAATHTEPTAKPVLPPRIQPRSRPTPVGIRGARSFERKDTPNPAQFRIACEKGFTKALQQDPKLKRYVGFSEQPEEEGEEPRSNGGNVTANTDEPEINGQKQSVKEQIKKAA